MMKLIIYNFQPLPKPRMTKNSSWAYPKYWEYFNHIKDLIWEKKVCSLGKKSSIITDDLKLRIKAFRKGKKRADASNILKGVEDAIEKSGLIKNDNQFVDVCCEVFYNNEEPKLEIEIKRSE